MPDLLTAGMDVNPSTRPETYPGRLVRTSCLVAGSWIYPLSAPTGQRTGRWRVLLDGGPLGPDPERDDGLDAVLRRRGAAAMDDRHPVLAVGSNASPAQLRHKLGASPRVSELVPVTRVRVANLGVAHSAHASRPGYLPYAPIARPGGPARDVVALWLDERQLARLDATEPNYHRVPLCRAGFPATSETGRSLPSVSVYRSRWGALRLTPTGGPARAMTQPQVFDLLARRSWFRALVPECRRGPLPAIRALGADPHRRTELREAMVIERLATGDRFPS